MIKNWSPISLLNIHAKLSSSDGENYLPSLISSNEILDIVDLSKIKDTIDREKVFDSVDHQFLINVLKTFRFEKKSVRWIKILLKNQELCITNGEITTKYFKLERGTRQGDPISAYLLPPIKAADIVKCVRKYVYEISQNLQSLSPF